MKSSISCVEPNKAEVTAPEWRPRRVCFPLEGFLVSGGYRVIIQIANALAARGHSVRILVPDFQAEPPFALHPEVTLEVVPTRGGNGLRKVYYLLYLCGRAARQADVVFATGFKTVYYVWLSSLLSRPRPRPLYLIQGYEVISNVQFRRLPGLLKRLLALVMQAGYRLPLEHVVVSRWTGEQVGSRRYQVIPNGVDARQFAPGPERTPSERLAVGVIGSLAPNKGYAILQKALDSLTPLERAQIQLRVAGRDAVALPEGIEATRISSAHDAMPDFYRECDLFVFPSFVEGFGLPPLEAMACGVPVIVSDCGGVREYVTPDNAWIVPPGDAHALADAIREALHNPALRQQRRQAGLETAQAHTVEAMTAQYCCLIETM